MAVQKSAPAGYQLLCRYHPQVLGAVLESVFKLTALYLEGHVRRIQWHSGFFVSLHSILLDIQLQYPVVAYLAFELEDSLSSAYLFWGLVHLRRLHGPQDLYLSVSGSAQSISPANE
jgi:hypothetical protein